MFVAAAVVLDMFYNRFASQKQFVAALVALPALLAIADSFAARVGFQAPLAAFVGGAVMCIIEAVC